MPLDRALGSPRRLATSTPMPGRERETGAAVALDAATLWRDAELPPLLSSFSEAALDAARDAVPTLPRALLVDNLPDDWLARLARLECVALDVDHQALDADIVRRVRAAGYRVLCYTPNESERIANLAACRRHHTDGRPAAADRRRRCSGWMRPDQGNARSFPDDTIHVICKAARIDRRSGVTEDHDQHVAAAHRAARPGVSVAGGATARHVTSALSAIHSGSPLVISPTPVAPEGLRPGSNGHAHGQTRRSS
jgi:hypothetical protein